MELPALRFFASRYTAAWCSQDPGRVALFFAANGSLTINGRPSVGREAIVETAREFMTALPDLVVSMDGVSWQGDVAEYRWSLTGTNTGPGGTGNPVAVGGRELWRMGADGLIAASEGSFDQADYDRQIRGE